MGDDPTVAGAVRAGGLLPSSTERRLLLATPAVAMIAVGVGLRLGGRDDTRGALVYAAPPTAGRALAWQIVVFDEAHGVREPAAGVPVVVNAYARNTSSLWRGITSADGVAEARLALGPSVPPLEDVRIEVRSGGALLAQGIAAPAPSSAPPPRDGGWLAFARREGRVALDVSVLGRRAAPGFPAEIWVRATDAASHAPVPHVAVNLENDTSISLAEPGKTDGWGWARVVVVPVGLAVTATFDAHAPDGRLGRWIGGLYMSPGAPRLETRRRWDPDAPIDIRVTMPTGRRTAYLEIDDANGRAWADALSLDARPDGTAQGTAAAGRLPAGRYWAIASADPSGDGTLGAGTTTMPFFVASNDAESLAYGTDSAACAAPPDARDTSNAASACLAVSTIAPVARWLAVDGFVTQCALARASRTTGLAVALGALAVAVALETMLLVRAGRNSKWRTVGLAVLVGLLGLALLAAFIVRA